MKKILRKAMALVTALAVLCTFAPTAFAGVEYSVEDAYYECAEMYPEFVEKIMNQGANERQIIAFLGAVQGYLLDLDFEITEENFEEYMLEAINQTIAKRQHITLRNALVAAFPEAAVDGMDGIIHDDFIPIVETIKRIIFDNGMLEDGNNGEEPTEEETEPPTEEKTEPPTEEKTEPPTEEKTEPPTEEKTEPPTEEKNEDKDKPGNGNGSTGGPAGDEDEPEDDPGYVTEPTEPPTAPKVTFTDMGQAVWAEKAVTALVGMGVINGYPDGTFKPNNAITRAEFAKIIVLTSGRYDSKATYTSTFTDVLAKDWHYPFVSAAYKFGFITGRSATIFDPNSNITRADLCLIVYRYIKSINSEFKAKTDANGNVAVFADFADVPGYAQEAVKVLYSHGIAPVRDTVNNKFEPRANATRAECAYIVHNAINAALGLTTQK